MMPLPKVPNRNRVHRDPLPDETKEFMAIKERETVFNDLGHLNERLEKLTDVITNLGESLRAVSIDGPDLETLEDESDGYKNRSQLSKLIRKSSDDVQRLIRHVIYLHENLDL